MTIMSCLVDLPYEFKTVKSQILFGSEITSIQEVFSRVLHTETITPNQHTNILIVRGGKNNKRGGNRTMDSRYNDSNNIVCYYCHK